MDHLDAAQLLDQARRAQSAAQATPVPRWTPPLAGVSVLAGFLALGLLPLGAWWRLTAVAIALTCWGAAGWLVLRGRRREGVRGLQGGLRLTVETFVACAAVLAVVGLRSDADLQKILLGMGVVAGGCTVYLTSHQKHARG